MNLKLNQELITGKKNITSAGQVEILSPAGSYESMVAAVNAGADAVYLGGSAFGARAYANNFDTQELLKAIDFVHIHGRKLYLTVNTLLKNNELEERLYNYIRPYYVAGLDAVIVQDMGVFNFIKQNFPKMDIHASTQMTISGADGAQLLKNMGATRVVTSRELSISEIRDIADNVDIEIESFVHGALCYCYSGQCLLSSMIGGRSGNRGRCAQPCRLPYKVDGTSTNEQYILSPKDICTISILPQIIDAGVYSLKIEGRMKNSGYAAGVVSKYRKYVDRYLECGIERYQVEEQDINDLMDLYNRGGFSEGYYVNDNGRNMISLTRPNHMGTKALTVVDNIKGNITFKALESINSGDIFEVGHENSFTSGKSVMPGEKFSVNLPQKYNIRKGDIIYRTRNGALTEDINERYINGEIIEKMYGKLSLKLGQNAKLTLSAIDRDGNAYNSADVTGEPVQEALKQPMTDEKVRKQLQKTGGTGFEFTSLDIDLDDNIFIPVVNLNDLRRNAIEQLRDNVCNSYRRQEVPDITHKLIEEAKNQAEQNLDRHKACMQTSEQLTDGENIINVSVNDSSQLTVILEYDNISGVYLDTAFYNNTDILLRDIKHCKNAGKNVYIRMPYVFRKNVKKIFDNDMIMLIDAGVDGFLVKSLDELFYVYEYKNLPINIIMDYNVYTFNQLAKQQYIKDKPDNIKMIGYTAPLELNESELNVLGINDSELVIYGKIPVMVSAQCVKKTSGMCDNKSGTIKLYDRKNVGFIVQSCCKYCYSVMYNSSPISLIDKLDSVKRLSPKSVRIEFTDEDENTIRDVLNEMLYHNGNVKNYTRGHFLRGVE